MLKKPLSVVGRDDVTEAIIIDSVIKDAVNAAIGVDVDEIVDIPVNRHHYGHYAELTNDAETNAFARNLADEAELHGLRLSSVSHPHHVGVMCHFKVHGRLS